MAILYKLRQDNRRTSRHKGCWFAHAVNAGTVDTDMLTRIIERNCSLKRSDVLAVLAELSDTMRDLLLSSHRVRLDGIGSFMPGLNVKAAKTPDDFQQDRDITDIHLCFIPEKTNHNGICRNTLLDGYELSEF